MDSKSIILGIAGASGSGKTTFTKKLISTLRKDKVTLISQDAYYKDLNYLSLQKKSKQNFDHPDSLDFELLKTHLNELQKGRNISLPVYDFNTHSRLSISKVIAPSKIIIVEGTLVMSQEQLLDLYDYTIYVDLDQNICLERRIERDIAERGRTKENILKQYKQTVKPMFNQFILPCKNKADLIIPGKNNKDSLKTVVKEIRKRENNLQ